MVISYAMIKVNVKKEVEYTQTIGFGRKNSMNGRNNSMKIVLSPTYSGH